TVARTIVEASRVRQAVLKYELNRLDWL
ncbi:MAG: hypothetical protein ACI8PT_004210, partial [Gammaproteobacteria bacterium]